MCTKDALSLARELEHERAMRKLQEADCRSLRNERDEFAARLSLSEASLGQAMDQLDAAHEQMRMMHRHYVKQLDSKFEDRMGVLVVEPRGDGKKWEPN